MEVIELSKKLGEALRETEEFKKYQAAREVCRANTELAAKIEEFKIQKQVYDTENEKEEPDQEFLGVVKERLDTLYDEVYSTDIMKDFNKAEDDFNILLNAVNMTISSYISEMPYSAEGECTHDCSTCHGCH